ncbi:hypothetical protein SAMN05421753_10190 [Planctomicrobium piriforme]|uniref:Uncharacterized protein n=2 Tax=Planctomicrobium piriforme TaxID=1576369 RepID=A0A1I3AW37_9PLAN|nr:hypothetical protein SAMN05421753_10190 [Planctomicrobium piriforme]
MSLRDTTDAFNHSSGTARAVHLSYPSEPLLFSSAATILETNRVTPTGWSLRRIFQRRGNVAITANRLFVESNLFSPLTLIWLVAGGFGIYKLFNGGESFNVILPIVGALFIFQRRPYHRDISFEQIRSIQFGSVRGVANRCDLMTVELQSHALQLVTAQPVPTDVRNLLSKISTVLIT